MSQFKFSLSKLTPSELAKLEMWYVVPFSVSKLIDALPHGSGIDCDWKAAIVGETLVLKNSYHFMNEMGGYDDWGDFELTFQGIRDFNLHHNTNFYANSEFHPYPDPYIKFNWVSLSPYHNRKYGADTGDYLHCLLDNDVYDFFKPAMDFIRDANVLPGRRLNVFVDDTDYGIDNWSTSKNLYVYSGKPANHDTILRISKEINDRAIIINSLILEVNND